MIKYRFAFNEGGQVICADEIAGQPVVDSYRCVGCGNELIAKVNGEKVKPHFAHKIQMECSGETYLHKLGKAVFVETYNKCLEDGEPFKIRLRSAKICTKFYPAIMTDCSLGEMEKEYDLTGYYQRVEVERRDGHFIPDVLLVSKTRPNEKIYIEIACTHFLSEQKERSNNRIIEIPIESEADIEKIKMATLSADEALFVGFNQASEAITDAECECASRKCYAFFVYESGKSNLELSSLAAVHAKAAGRGKAIYSNLFFPDGGAKRRSFEDQSEGGRLYIEQVKLAASRNIPIRNCYICRYHGENYDSVGGHAIYCKTFRKTCSSNEAAGCERYRRDA